MLSYVLMCEGYREYVDVKSKQYPFASAIEDIDVFIH